MSMNGGRMTGGVQADWLPWPWPVVTTGPGPELVACPMPGATAGGLPAAAQAIYRLAYERALAAAKPSRYALAASVSTN
jgi:hypothetical protein